MNESNQTLIREYKEISRKMRELTDTEKLSERNSYVPRIHELNELIDWGYRAGERVERITGRGWERDTIIKVESSVIYFRTIQLPPAMVRTAEEKYEQVSLF